MAKEYITIGQCHKLRELTQAFTSSPLLTQDEFDDILLVYARAADRLEKEGRVRDD